MTTEPPLPPQENPAPVASTQETPKYSWTDKLAAVLFCVFCFEVGFFLLLYPWLGELWAHNWLIQLFPEWKPYLLSEQVRGAVSGLGILNLFIAVSEVFRLRRFSRN